MLSEGSGPGNGRGHRLALLFIFFLSGASGLIYEVVWSRSLVLVFGSTTYAVSTVLAAFMGGLALGSLLVGRRGDRFGDPLKVYALMEAAIAVLALAVLAVLPALIPLYRVAFSLAGASPAALNALRFALAGLVLLAPTTLMGATLPILSAHLERHPAARGPRDGGDASGTGAGALYAANTIGAVAGTALTGFLLLPLIGLKASAFVAAGANLAAAAAAFYLARARVRGAVPAVEARAEPRASTTAGTERAPVPFIVLLLVFAASGAGALIFEVVWTRILSLVLGSSTQAFTIMLATFLSGLALGCALTTRLLPRIPDAVQALTLIELSAGFTAITGIWLFPELPYAFLKLYAMTGDSPILFGCGRFLLASLVMLPPTLFLGAAFPLTARAALRRGGAVSSPVASLYASNTIGAILGSCAAGFLLIPWIGLQAALMAGCALNVAAGALLLACSSSQKPILRYGLSTALLVILPGLVTAMPPWDEMIMTSGVFQYAPRYLQQFRSRREFVEYHAAHSQLFYKDGPTTTVSVERRPERMAGKVNTVLSVNGKVDASSVGDMDTQVLLGQLPLLVATDPRSALVIGMGSGVSAGSTLTHPIERLTIVEIEPAIMAAQTWFEPINGRPLEDPRARVRINDARNDLLVSPERYDIIMSEPSNPWLTGPSKLFTREFFELARSRLAPSGLLCQWIQLYGMDVDSVKVLLRTFATVFPHRMVFKGSVGDILILGGADPIRLDLERISARMAPTRVSADLARVKVFSPEDLLARFRMGDADFDAFVGAGPERPLVESGPLNTDDNAYIEFAAARSLFRDDYQANDVEISKMPTTVLPHLVVPDPRAEGPGGTVALLVRLAARLTRANLLERADALLDAATALDDPGPAGRASLIAARGDLLNKRADSAGAERAWTEALALYPLQPRATIGIASRRIASGDAAGAVKMLEKAAGDPACLLELGRARLVAGDPEGALQAVRRFEDPAGCSGQEAGHDPETGPFAHLYQGRALVALGRYEEGRPHLRLYFDLYPETPRPAETSIDAASDLALASLALGDHEGAIAQYRTITGLADSLASWNHRQAAQAIERQDLAAAASYLRTALRWNRKDSSSRRLLARTLNDLERQEEAIQVWRDLDKEMEGDAEALRNIAGLAMRMKRPADAIAALRRLSDIEEDPEAIRGIDQTIGRLQSGIDPSSAPGTGGAPGGELRR
ncbi:MAG TPA: fused MFS/spermidine synthase [Candidatus Polarisedimenticolia bacterium]|jgi:spermidine synthase